MVLANDERKRMPGEPGAKYLPGMEGDPAGAILENWTDADWGEWFRSEVDGTNLFSEIDEHWGKTSSQRAEDASPWRKDSDLAEAADALRRNADEMRGLTSGGRHEAEPDDAFERLSTESKIKFFNGWQRVNPAYEYKGHYRRPDTEATPPPKKKPKWMIPVIVAAAIAAIFLVGINLGSGDGADTGDDSAAASSGSGSWSAIDTEDDFEATWDDFDAIEDPNTAGDITGMDVGVEDDTTTVSIQFRGAAQSINGTPGESLDADVLITLPDGRIVNVIWGADRCKISEPPQGWSVECVWVTTGELQFRIKGFEAEPGTKFSFGTIQGFGGAFSSDTVELVTN